MPAGEAQAQERSGAFAPLVKRLEAEQARWFFWVPVLLGLGVGIYFSLPSEPHLLTALAGLGAALALRIVAPRRTLLLLAANVLLAVTTGFALAKVRVEWVRAPVLAKERRSVEVKGFVELIEPRPKRGERLTLRVSALGDLPEDARPVRVRITTGKPAPGIAPGDPVRLRATLQPPSGPALPGGHDFAKAAWFERLGAVGYTWSAPVLDATAGEPPPSLRAWAHVERLRRSIGQRIKTALPGEEGAIANALITGERGGIPETTTTAFRDSGLLHVLSISGLHMAIMAGSVFYLVRMLLAAFPAIALRYPIKKWAAAAALTGAFGYLMISGSAFPTVRSAIMISIMFLAVLLDRPALALRNVVLAAILILVLFPESLLDVGFQMSFAAVVALVSVYEAFARRGGWSLFAEGPWAKLVFFFVGIVLSTLIASAAVAPFAAYHFHKSQQYAVIANLIAMPICNLLIMPAALATLILMPLGLEAGPLWVMGTGIDGMLWTARRVAALPGAVLHIPAMPAAAFLMMVAGGLWLALWQTRWRMLGAALIAGGIALAPASRLPDLLIGRDGALVAMREDDGRLAAVGATRDNFELERWLEHDGDGRTPSDAARGERIACDRVGCRASVKGLTVAVAQHPAAFADDCRRAAIVISKIVSPKSCSRPKAVVDFFAARREGTHAIYIEDDGTLKIETVARSRGQRPWSARVLTSQSTRHLVRDAARSGAAQTRDPAVNASPSHKIPDSR
ncbi:MAG TPA: ComEC/Rec2 family competence protein [Hyphomicrobium sp.]